MARKAKKAGAPSAADTRRKVDKLSKIGDLFDLWQPAADVLVPVRGVRTRFLWLDSVTKIGAWPTERVCTVHGPSGEGKSAVALGLGASFLDGGGFFGLIDAELTTPITWIRSMMPEHAGNPRFLALRPQTYEQSVAAARQFCNGVLAWKEAGKIPEDASGLLVVDSMRKLVPKNLLDNLMKQASTDDDDSSKSRWSRKPKGIDGMGGRAAQVKAALNAQWLDELIPLAAKSGTSVLLIARELGDDDDSSVFAARKGGTVAGGKALIYDASLVVRVTRANAIMKGEGPAARLVGERHSVEIRKTKIGSKDVVYPKAYFHTMTSPARFDPARDLVGLGRQMGAIELEKGSHYYFEGVHLGHGEDAAVESIANDPLMLVRMQEVLRSRFELEGAALVESTTKPTEAATKRPARRRAT
jgi:RecA/RadA recombinase